MGMMLKFLLILRIQLWWHMVGHAQVTLTGIDETEVHRFMYEV